MKIFPADPASVDIVRREHDFSLFYLGKPLLSPGAHEICSPNQRALKQIVMETCYRKSISDQEISAYAILSLIADFIDQGRDPFLENFGMIADHDPFIRLREGEINSAGLSGSSLLNEMIEKEPMLFNLVFWATGGLLEAFTLFSLQNRKDQGLGTQISSWKDFLRKAYEMLPSYAKAVVNLLSFSHSSDVVLPLLMASGFINASEYVSGLPSLHLKSQGETIPSPYAVPVTRIRPGLIQQLLPGLLEDAGNAAGFLSCFRNRGSEGLDFIIRKGEGHDLEFKSTLRWDLKAGKTSQHVERACLKTISAFLNSNGGVLLIGIRDDGTAEGIESDRFANPDKFQLHFWTLVRTSFGTDISPCIRAELESFEGRTIFIVRCTRSDRPVFLRQPGFEEEFYIRVGPGTVALAVSEALKYISDHFRQ